MEENVKLSPSLGKIDANAREGWRLAGAIAFNKLPSPVDGGGLSSSRWLTIGVLNPVPIVVQNATSFPLAASPPRSKLQRC